MTNSTALCSPEKERGMPTCQLSSILGQRGEVKVSAPELFSSAAAIPVTRKADLILTKDRKSSVECQLANFLAFLDKEVR